MNATPQLEDGYVRIANELMETILGFGFSHREQSVIFTIIRKTYGYGKKEDDMSASQIGEICKLARPHVSATLNQLALRNVIIKRPGRYGSIVGIQKDHRKWTSSEQTKPAPASTESVHGSTESVHVPNQYMSSTESVQVDSTDSVHTKDNLPKDNHQKKRSCAPQANRESESRTSAGRQGRAMTGSSDDLRNRFERFYAAYPRKKSRKQAEKAFASLKPDEQLLGAILAGLARAMKSGEWSDPKFIPYPATWLNAHGWLDDVQTEYTLVERGVIEAFNELLGSSLGEVSVTIFVQARAAMIKEFLTFSTKDNLAKRYFAWLRDETDLPPKIGFDRLIGRQGYSDAIGGKFSRKAA